MPACFLLATADAQLASVWERQIPAGRQIVRMPSPSFETGAPHGVSAVVILDASEEDKIPSLMSKHPTIFVGEPHSAPFEQVRLSGKARVCLSYEDSTRRLRDLLPLIEEIADRQAMVELMQQRMKRGEPSPRAGSVPIATAGISLGSTEWWDFVEGAVESLDSRERLLGEFRRAARRLLRASHAVFFLRDGDCIKADRGSWICRMDDPLVLYLEENPSIIDGRGMPGASEPLAELAMRNHLSAWGARLLVPIHDNGRLLGFMTLGVRDDGREYDEEDAERAVGLARMLRQLLVRHEQLLLLEGQGRNAAIGAKYLPSSLILGADDKVPAQVPVVVRELVGQVKHFHTVRRLEPSLDQRYRASAGPIAETGGVWVTWEEADEEVRVAQIRRFEDRRELLRELALTLCHEMGNPLVSLSTFRQMAPERAIPPSLIQTLRQDVARLEVLEHSLALMQSLSESTTDLVDVCVLARKVGESCGIAIETDAHPVTIRGSSALLEFCLRSLIGAIAENQSKQPQNSWSLAVRSTGTGADTAALLAFKGAHLELEGILPEATPVSTPRLGRMSVFLAKEIIR
ncbi:MAG: GAF domain-containing protein, partial [Opitutaceae bacterium]